MKRRTLLQNLLRGGVALSASSIPYGLSRLLAPEVSAAPVRNYCRPPGALSNDQDFVDACIGCGLCGEICPPKCIKFHQRDAGNKVNTPYINPPDKACILCDKCMQICPTEALTETPKDQIDMGIAQIDRSACYPWVDRGVCGACVAACPLGNRAIVFEFAGFYKPIVKLGCVGCGLCVEVCPHPSVPIWIVDRAEGSVARHTV